MNCLVRMQTERWQEEPHKHQREGASTGVPGPAAETEGPLGNGAGARESGRPQGITEPAAETEGPQGNGAGARESGGKVNRHPGTAPISRLHSRLKGKSPFSGWTDMDIHCGITYHR